MPSKEKDDALDTCELGVNIPCASGHMSSDSGEKDNEFRDQRSPEERGEVGGDVPWEKRYEKLWVEVEKRDVKSTFKNVAGELKEKFGELFKSRCTAEDVTEEEQATAESTSAEEESSDEEEGEVIVRPTTRARSTVLLTIPEQRESGLEDSESTDNSLCEERMQVCDPPASESSMCRDPHPPADDDVLEESRSPLPQITTAKRDSNLNTATVAFTEDYTKPVSDVGRSAFIKDETKLRPFCKQQLELILKDTPDDLDETEKSHVSTGEDPEEFDKFKSHSLSRCSASIPAVSDEEDFERFKFEVGMLKLIFMDLEKDNIHLLKEVEDGRPLFQ